MPHYVSAAEMKAMKISGKPTSFCDWTDNEIEDEVEVAEATVERITGNIFYAKTETNKFDGNGMTRLFFQPRISYKLLSVIGDVYDYDVDGTTVLETYEENDDFVRYDYYLETALEFEGDSPRRRFGSGGVWPKGQKNIAITGIWGYNPRTVGIGTAKVITGASTAVVGSGTRFLRHFIAGSLFELDGTTYTVQSIASDTGMTITTNYSGTKDSFLSYYYYPVPVDIKKVTRYLAAENLDPGCTNLSVTDIKTATWDDFSVTMKGESGVLLGAMGGSSGFPELDRILINYVNYTGMFIAVPSTKQVYSSVK